jgi:hypothetical protein
LSGIVDGLRAETALFVIQPLPWFVLILGLGALGVKSLYIDNPKTRKLSTLLLKQRCSHSGFIGIFDDPLYSYIACWLPYLNSRHKRPSQIGSLHGALG